MGKDPNAPKRPLSAYFLYMADIRAKTVKENPQASMTQMSGIIAGKWKKLSDSQKKPYEAKAAKAKAAYQKKMEKYKNSAAYKKFQDSNQVPTLVKNICKKFNIVCKKRNPTQFPSDPNAPKRAPSAFFLFGASVRPALQKKLKGKPVSAVAKAIGEQWSKISDSEKAKFEKKATVAKKGVEASRKKYEKTTSFKNYQAAKKEFLKQKKALAKEQN